MYTIKKRLEISASHRLALSYESKCNSIHGHNWIIYIYCKGETLNANGILVDFTHIKKQITEKLDHKHLNDVFDFNPTAENMAKWIVETVPLCYKATVIESENNEASYEK